MQRIYTHNLRRMRITGLQMDIEWSSPRTNIQAAERLLEESEKSDLYVLPEMWSTGFAIDPRGIAESDDSTLQWMRRTSSRLDAALCGSLSIYTSEQYYNRHYFVFPDGTYEWYDKRHLFTPGHEDRYYTKGSSRTVVTWRDMCFLLQTCYDLRFPVWSRYAGDYDAIIYVANWPEARIGAWETLLRARAIENQSYVIGVNRVGRDPYKSYNGHSAIIGPKGEVLAERTEPTIGLISEEIDKATLLHFRDKFQILEDRDYR